MTTELVELADRLEAVLRLDLESHAGRSEISACIDAIRALASRAGGWRPIDSAPRDGRFVLVYASDELSGPEDQTAWVAAFDSNQWWYAGCEYAVFPEPTHWQPLPEPPALDSGGAGRGGGRG